MACVECDCSDFAPNPFKPKRCNNCFHNHDESAPSAAAPKAAPAPSATTVPEQAREAPKPVPSEAPGKETEAVPKEEKEDPPREVTGDESGGVVGDDGGTVGNGGNKEQEAPEKAPVPEPAPAPPAPEVHAAAPAVSPDAQQCTACAGPIDKQDWVSANGAPYHVACFLCESCGCSLGGAQFADVNGKPHCAPCYERHHAPKCAGCGKMLEGDYVIVGGETLPDGTVAPKRNYHRPCFVCSKCGGAFGDSGHFTDASNALICPTCASGIEPQQGEACAGCGGAIVGDAVRALGSYRHPRCFTCLGCAGEIGEAEFLVTPGGGPCHRGCQQEALEREKNGKDGKDGKDGKEGKDGKDGKDGKVETGDEPLEEKVETE